MTERIDLLTRAYILLREKKKAMEKEFKERLENEVGSKMAAIEIQLEKHLLETGCDSLPNKFGTPYRTTVTSPKVVDWDACRDFIEENGLQHWYVRKVTKEGVDEYIEAHNETPPGVTIVRRTNINVRSKS
jgi:hypothetical protein